MISSRLVGVCNPPAGCLQHLLILGATILLLVLDVRVHLMMCRLTSLPTCRPLLLLLLRRRLLGTLTLELRC
jgi:hypothetical protein